MGVLIYSCSEDEQVPSTMDVRQTENFISLDKASGIASVIKYPLSLNPKNANLRAKGVTNTFKEIESLTKVPDKHGNTSYYIVNYEDDGFVMISAHNRINPILAYSDTVKFPLDESTYPNGLVEWLVGSKDFIKKIRESNLEQTSQVARAWESCEIQKVIRPIDDDCVGNSGGCENQYTTVEPLLSTIWGQLEGYNDLAPNLGCTGDGRAPTGCVATAMAQVMKYHEFPNNYNWDNMPDLWGTMETARLMRDVGDAVDMNWGCNGSGA